jgi:hypothetical protein
MLPLCYWGKEGGDLREEQDVVVLVGGVRGVDGPLRSAQDRPVLRPHPLLRAGAADAVLLQAQAAAQGRQGRGEAPHQVPPHRRQLQGWGQGAQDAPWTCTIVFLSLLLFGVVLFLFITNYDDDPFRALPLLLQMLYVLCVYNKREKHNRITMAAFNIQEALIWKEKIEMVIDQQQGAAQIDGNRAISSSQQKASLENGRKSSSSDHESQ